MVAAVEESEVQKQVVLLDLAVMLVEQTNTTLLHMVQVAVVVPVMLVKMVAHPKVVMVVLEHRFQRSFRNPAGPGVTRDTWRLAGGGGGGGYGPMGDGGTGGGGGATTSPPGSFIGIQNTGGGGAGEGTNTGNSSPTTGDGYNGGSGGCHDRIPNLINN